MPAYIGIAGGANATGLSSLHTHDSSGVIHIESPAGRRFTLSQVFNEWNVLLSPTQIGSLKTGGGKTLTTYVNGKVLTTDPGKLELVKHQEIAIVYGTAGGEQDGDRAQVVQVDRRALAPRPGRVAGPLPIIDAGCPDPRR